MRTGYRAPQTHRALSRAGSTVARYMRPSLCLLSCVSARHTGTLVIGKAFPLLHRRRCASALLRHAGAQHNHCHCEARHTPLCAREAAASRDEGRCACDAARTPTSCHAAARCGHHYLTSQRAGRARLQHLKPWHTLGCARAKGSSACVSGPSAIVLRPRAMLYYERRRPPVMVGHALVCLFVGKRSGHSPPPKPSGAVAGTIISAGTDYSKLTRRGAAACT